MNFMTTPKLTPLDVAAVERLLDGAKFRSFASPGNSSIIEITRLETEGATGHKPPAFALVNLEAEYIRPSRESASRHQFGFLATMHEFTATGEPAQRFTTSYHGEKSTTATGTSSARFANRLLQRAAEFLAEQNIKPDPSDNNS